MTESRPNLNIDLHLTANLKSNLLRRKRSGRHRSILVLLVPHLSLICVCGRGWLSIHRSWLVEIHRLNLLPWLPIRLLLDLVVFIRRTCLCSIHSLLVRLLYVWRRCASSSLAVTQDDEQSMNYAWNVTQNAEENVEEEVNATAAADDDCNGWEQDC
jgi:hypothetical protein